MDSRCKRTRARAHALMAGKQIAEVNTSSLKVSNVFKVKERKTKPSVKSWKRLFCHRLTTMAKVVFVSYSKKLKTLISRSPSGVGLDEKVGRFPRGGRHTDANDFDHRH